MGHGDVIVIADANFPSDATASNAIIKTPIRVHGSTADILKDILQLMPLDTYVERPISVMDRVPSDKERDLEVPGRLVEYYVHFFRHKSQFNLNACTFKLMQISPRLHIWRCLNSIMLSDLHFMT